MSTSENINQMESGYRLSNIILLESDFKRVANVIFNDAAIKQNIDVDVNVSVKDNSIYVVENVFYSQIINGIEQVKCTIIMSGLFEKIGESKLEDLEQFGRINGAAIIFPYIREHLSNLSSKAGLGLILLPPVNFTQK